MVLMIFLFVYFMVILLLIRPLLLLLGGKILKISHFSFKKCVIASIWIFALGILVSIAAFIVYKLIPGLYIPFPFYKQVDILYLIGSFFLITWVIEKKLETTKNQAFGVAAIFLATALFVVFLITSFVFQSFVIPSPSMQPTVLIGDRIIVNKFIYNFTSPARGEIISFKHPLQQSQIILERLIGLPGETVKIANNKVFIDGRPIAEPYAIFSSSQDNENQAAVNFPPLDPGEWNPRFPVRFRNSVKDTPDGKVFVIPKGYYFCMGDNRDFSYDSRYWGPLPAGHVTGKAWGIYWSIESSAVDYLPGGFWKNIKDIFSSVPDFFFKTRWKRIGKDIR